MRKSNHEYTLFRRRENSGPRSSGKNLEWAPCSCGKNRAFATKRNYADVGEYLKYGRSKANLTQMEVSLALEYSSSQFISNFERGISLPPLKKLRTLVSMYRLNPDKLIALMIDSERGVLHSQLRGIE